MMMTSINSNESVTCGGLS